MKQGKTLAALAAEFERLGGRVIDLTADEWRDVSRGRVARGGRAALAEAA